MLYFYVEPRYWEKTRMRGFPHSNEPEISMKEELWVGVTPSGWMQIMWWGDESPAQCDETKGRGLGKNQAQ
ncbi:MAG: hypothetical protein RQ885_12330 [Desulfurococcales archaeon]|nr:hypothetical protein [Desulfurococcales archaeon]